jgi:cation:H+ antiporter
MINNLFILVAALALVVKGATMATKHAEALAHTLPISRYAVGFIVVAVISILPETLIGISAALAGTPEFGLGVLFGSNVADLTLVFAIILFFAGRGLKIESRILKNHAMYPALLALPLILGFDGFYSRAEGLVLIIAGAAFYYLTLRDSPSDETLSKRVTRGRTKNLLLLLVSMVLLLVGAHFTVESATALATLLGVSPVLIGMLIVGLGTTMPELFFSLESVREKDDSLAVGDLLGTVLADATVVVGILALIHPFSFPIHIIYLTGGFMVLASLVLFTFMRSGHTLTTREGNLLFVLWVVFVFTEFVTSL